MLTLTLPTYETTLPISGKTIKYRPFVTREQKILLLAQEENNQEAMIRAIGQIISECTFGVCSIDNLNKPDAEFLFIQMRNKSMGEGVEVNGICQSCEKKTRLTLNLDEIKVSNEIKGSTIKLADDTWITLKLPTMKESMSIGENQGDLALAYSLDTIIKGDSSSSASDYSIEDRVNFIGGFTQLQLTEFNDFLDSFPAITFKHDYNCKHCDSVNTIELNSLADFFL
jgi:hypothetical protein